MNSAIHQLPGFVLRAGLAFAAICGATGGALAQSVPLLVQAESMTLVSPMAAAYDIAAMAGRFISPAGGTSGSNPQRNASVDVTVPTGTYFLWARIAGASNTSDALYVGIDSSFDRVFPSAFGPYQWVRVETSDGSGVHGFALTGTHTLQVGFGEIGAKLDALYLTADANEVPNFTAPAKLLIEAEALNRTAPMTPGSEPAALGGQFISPTSGGESFTPVREASIPVQVPAGTFYLWARIAGPSATSDALYAGINSSFDRIFPSGVASGAYQWVRVETADGNGVHGFALTAGTHIIQVGHGEINARLDAVYLTSDANEVPAFAPMRRVIEAESFSLLSPMTVGVDANASGAQFISPTSGTNSTTPIREAFTTVTAPASGTYYLWARIGGPSSAADALYVGFDSAFTRVFPANAVPYDWVRVEASPGVPGFSLAAGAHDIQVGHGEIGARLDAVYVTDSETDSPNGSTPPSSGGFPERCALPNGGYEGFGRNTLRDPNLPVRAEYVVSRLDDPGVAGTPGTLRDALSQPNRCIVFSIGGEINLVRQVNVRGNVMIDGFTAPSRGITLRMTATTDQPALNIQAVNEVVVRGIRIRLATDDGITVFGASNVVIDRVSISGFGDGAIDVTEGSRNVTLQWSILGVGRQDGNIFTNLIGLGAMRVSTHHNLYIDGEDRQPKCGGIDNAQPTPEITCDVRNNVIWDYTLHGTTVRHFGWGNVVNNYYKAAPNQVPERAIFVAEGGVAFVSGNHSHNGANLNDNGNRSTEFPADVPAFTDARAAALAVKNGAGARGPNFGLDEIDQPLVDRLSIQ